MRSSWNIHSIRPASDAAASVLLVLDVVVVIRAERTRVAGGAG